MRVNVNDLDNIASALSSPGDSFPVDQLVSFGTTVILKPGATTSRGRKLSGDEVLDRLAGRFDVFPLSVTYGVDADAATPERLHLDMNSLEAELDSLGDEEIFGASAAVIRRLQQRYTRLVASYRRFAALAFLPNRKHAANMARKLSVRLDKIWSKMRSKGIPTSGLVSPASLRAQVTQALPVATQVAQNFKTQAPMYPQQASVYQEQAPMYPEEAQAYPDQAPVYPEQAPEQPRPRAAVHPDYYRDQAALESELAEKMPSLFGADEAHDELVKDSRAEAMGYAFGKLEHDYWGLEGGDVEMVFSDPDDLQVLEQISGYDLLSFGADEDEDEGEEEDADASSASSVAARMDDETPLSPEEAKTASRTRTQASEATKSQRESDLDTVSTVAKTASGVSTSTKSGRLVNKLASFTTSLMPLVQKISARFGEEAPNGGVDYGRVRPARHATSHPVIVIAIRKANDAPALRRLRGKFGGNSEVNALDILGAEIVLARRGREDLSPLLAMSLYQQHMDARDLVTGSRSPWPFGSDSPLPPPRHTGPEVH